MQTLTLLPAVTKSQPNRPGREYFDFAVAGQLLRTILGLENEHYATLIGFSTDKEQETHVLNVFRLKEKSDLATGRVMIYVCPDCGDIGCGAITAAILDLGTKIVWRDFAYESGDDGLPDEYLNIEPIEFERQNYFSAFSK